MSGNYLLHRGLRRGLAFLLALAMLVGSLGIAGISADTVHAADSEGYATVRIEAGGQGVTAEGATNPTKTVLEETVVDLSKLSSQKAIEAVEVALQERNLKAPSKDGSGMHISFGDIYAPENHWWSFMLNDKSAIQGLDGQSIIDGDSIVLFLQSFDGRPIYSYLAKDTTSFYNDGSSLYVTASLILLENIPAVWGGPPSYDLISPEGAAPLGDVGITVTKDDVTVLSTQSDLENGIVDLVFNETGIYKVSASKYENGKATVCPAYCEVEVSDTEIIVKNISSALDTSLETLDLLFKGTDKEDMAISGIGYLGGVMSIGNQYSEVELSAIASAENGTEGNDDDVLVSLSYKSDKDSQFNEAGTFDYKGTSKTVPLEEGENIVKLMVSNGLFDTQTHTLVIKRNYALDKTDETVSDIIHGVKLITGIPINPDWVLSMGTAGLKTEITAQNRDAFLSRVLLDVRKYNNNEYVSIGTLAKYAIALTSLGIDARYLPDEDGNPIDLIELIAEQNEASSMDAAYQAPYVLMLFDLGVYDLNNYQSAKFTIADLMEHILNNQNEISHLWPDFYGFPGIDETGMVLPALSRYHKSNESELNGVVIADVKTAVNNAVSALSAKQTMDGGFDTGWGTNANTASTIASGLISLGINPHTDGRFIKNSVSLIDNILAFKTTDNTLGYKNNSVTDSFASIQGYQALASYQNLKKGSSSTNIYDVNEEVNTYIAWPDAKLLTSIAITTQPLKTTYDLDEGEGSATTVNTAGIEVTAYYNGNASDSRIIEEGYTISTIDTTTPGTKSVTVTYQGHTATFNVTVKGSGGSVPEEKTVKITVKSSGKGTIASNSSYVIESEKTTVMDALKAVLSKAGKLYVIQGNAYVSEIDGLGEFSSGTNSGWLYYVDGVDPGKSASSYKLDGGEVIEWIYTLDYTKESGAEKWNQTLLPEEITGTIAKNSLNSVLKDIEAGKADSWTVSLAQGDVMFDKEALAGLVDQMAGDSVDITIEQASNKDLSAKQREAAGDRPVYDISIISGKKSISQFGGKLTISLPYTLKEGERPSGIVVYHLDAEGNLVPMEGAYDPVAGKVVFTVDHLSYFVIGYDETLAKWPFADVAENDNINWFYSPVKFVYERGIFSGTGANTFSPNSPLTRSMLASVLARMSGADLTAYKSVAFGDVDINSWYGPSVAWAKEMGIVSGYANKDGSYDFRPDAKISRQDIAVMLNNYNERVAKKTYGQTTSAVSFTDRQQIAEYAKPAVESMQQAGIINGIKNADGSFRFQPINNATRAEAATMIYNMLTNK